MVEARRARPGKLVSRRIRRRPRPPPNARRRISGWPLSMGTGSGGRITVKDVTEPPPSLTRLGPPHPWLELLRIRAPAYTRLRDG